MAFQGIQPLEQGQVLPTRFKLPDTNDVVQVTARVVWLNELGKGGGLQFTDLSEESRHLILRWCSLQDDPRNQTRAISACPPKVELKESPPSAPLASEECEPKPSGETEEDSLVSIPCDAPAPAEVTAIDNSKAEAAPSADMAQENVRVSGSRSAWIMPLTMGASAFFIILIAIMSIFGVISFQFRWPPLKSDETLAEPAAESQVDQVSGTSFESASSGPAKDPAILGQTASDLSPAISKKDPAVKRAQPESMAPTRFPEGSAASAESDSRKLPPQLMATARPIAPNPVRPVTFAAIAPPTLALPSKLESAPKLPMISPPAPAPPSLNPPRKSAKFDPPQVARRKDPVYPMVAKAAGISGSVELQFTITAEGKVRDVSAMGGNPVLIRAAVEAVNAWRYRPARLGGVPVESQSTAIFNFKPN